MEVFHDLREPLPGNGSEYGYSCDSGTILNILARRNASELALIAKEYRNMYSEDLKERMSSELSGDLKKAVLLWMHDPAGRDATALSQALSGVPDLKGASEVICSRTPSQMQQFKQAYHAMFDVHLEHDIDQKASRDNRKLLLAYLTKTRSESKDVDETLVEVDARILYQAGEKKIGTDEDTFIRIFSERSWAHLAAVNSAYFRMYGNSLKKAVKNETSGKFRFSLLTILQCAENPGKYFAKALNAAMKGLGTDTTTLTRIIVTRAEVDMGNIKAEYGKKFGKSLNDAVHSDTSGDYRTFLLALLGPGQSG
ncbi:annexin D5-like isoform X2 [Diospyros lotus]|uniref:annexin D5-like isoform X2 n=1 Tax=Diospyros lotus TaxID=55363 RepID=UPI00225BFD5E|nr:annexin D5-like isoform X2 [Diospyros lotus]